MAIQKTPNYDSYSYSQLVEKRDLFVKEEESVNEAFLNYVNQVEGENSRHGETEIRSINYQANAQRYMDRLFKLQSCIRDLNNRIEQKLPGINSLATANPAISPIRSGINSFNPYDSYNYSQLEENRQFLLGEALNVLKEISGYMEQSKTNGELIRNGETWIVSFDYKANIRRYLDRLFQLQNCVFGIYRGIEGKQLPEVNSLTTVTPTISPIRSGINSFNPAANPSIPIMSPGINSFNPTVSVNPSVSVMSPGINSFNPTANPSIPAMSPGINSTTDVFNSKIETYIDTKIEAYFKQRGSATSMTNTGLPSDTRGSDALNSKIETLINSKIEAIFSQGVPAIPAAHSSQNNNSNLNNFSFDNEYMNIPDVNDDFQ